MCVEENENTQMVMYGDLKQRELWQLEKKITDLINEGFITAFDPLIDYLRKLYEKKNNPAVFIPVA